jgi:hypothetical protein
MKISTARELKDIWLRLKLEHGDHRGMRNKLELAERFGIKRTDIRVDPKAGLKTEVYADVAGYGRIYYFTELMAAARYARTPAVIQFKKTDWPAGRESILDKVTFCGGKA